MKRTKKNTKHRRTHKRRGKKGGGDYNTRMNLLAKVVILGWGDNAKKTMWSSATRRAIDTAFKKKFTDLQISEMIWLIRKHIKTLSIKNEGVMKGRLATLQQINHISSNSPDGDVLTLGGVKNIINTLGRNGKLALHILGKVGALSGASGGGSGGGSDGGGHYTTSEAAMEMPRAPAAAAAAAAAATTSTAVATSMPVAPTGIPSAAAATPTRVRQRVAISSGHEGRSRTIQSAFNQGGRRKRKRRRRSRKRRRRGGAPPALTRRPTFRTRDWIAAQNARNRRSRRRNVRSDFYVPHRGQVLCGSLRRMLGDQQINQERNLEKWGSTKQAATDYIRQITRGGKRTRRKRLY